MELETTTTGGETVYVAAHERERGSKGPFQVVYLSPDCDVKWGLRCGNCGSFATAMDTMGRVECTDCGNLRKPDEWDAAHE